MNGENDLHDDGNKPGQDHGPKPGQTIPGGEQDESLYEEGSQPGQDHGPKDGQTNPDPGPVEENPLEPDD
jgi:hypothetical protein